MGAMKTQRLTPAFVRFIETPMVDLLMEMFLARKWEVNCADALAAEDGTIEVRLPDGREFEITVTMTHGAKPELLERAQSAGRGATNA